MNISNELNQSCEERRLFGNQELSDNAELGLRYFALVYYIALFPLSLSLTGLIIFLIIKFKHLQQATFFLALQVEILDFFSYLLLCLQLLFLQLMDNGQLDYTHAISLVEYYRLLYNFVIGSCLCLSAIAFSLSSGHSDTTDTEGK